MATPSPAPSTTPVAPSPAPGAPTSRAPNMPLPYHAVKLDEVSYGKMIKDTSARLYVVPLEPPIRIQTTPMTLTTSLEDPSIAFVYVQPDVKLRDFFERTETAICNACIAHKNEWFAIAKNLDDDTLRHGYKSFFGEQGFKLKVGPDVACFDADKKPIGREDIPAGTVVRAILELSRVCFGRHEFGATWKVAQVQLVPTECYITMDPIDDAPSGDTLSDSDVDEFL